MQMCKSLPLKEHSLYFTDVTQRIRKAFEVNPVATGMRKKQYSGYGLLLLVFICLQVVCLLSDSSRFL